jgi:hypothetical protein
MLHFFLFLETTSAHPPFLFLCACLFQAKHCVIYIALTGVFFLTLDFFPVFLDQL